MTDEQAEEEAQRIFVVVGGKSKGICLAQGFSQGAGYARYFQVCPLICQPDSPRYKRNIMADTKTSQLPAYTGPNLCATSLGIRNDMQVFLTFPRGTQFTDLCPA
nr:hypothetical protein [Escherichia coli]